MAKKFGKFLLFTAAVGSAAAAVYYYMQKKDAAQNTSEDEDYDDFGDDPEEASESSRSYVPLTPEHKTASDEEPKPTEGDKPADADSGKTDTFTPLSEQLTQAAQTAEETVEEFFDEEDAEGVEPSIKDE